MEQAGLTWVEVKELVTTVLAFLGLGGLTIGSVTLAAWGLFKWLGGKWIDQRFEKQMEAYKTEQDRELERLRHKINAVFDRTIRLHSKEYEVLPDLWAKLVDAHGWAWSYLSLLQNYPDVGRMDAAELEEFLKTKPFSEAHKREITTSSNKLNSYIEISERYRYGDVMEKIREFNVSFRKTGIFVKPEIKADMEKMSQFIRHAVNEHQMNQEDKPRPRLRDEYKRLEGQGEPLFKKIEEAVAARLWDPTTTEV